MAKQVHEISYVVKVAYVAGVRDSVQLFQVNYTTCDSSETDLRGHNGLHGAEAVPREVGATSGLLDTIDQLNVDLEAEVKTKEGI